MKIGEIVLAEVDQVETYGLYLACEGGRIFVQIPDIDWIQRIADPREFTQIGESFRVLIVGYDGNKNLFIGSIKDASPESNPWRDPRRFAVGSVHQAKVINTRDSGTFVEIQAGVEGLIILGGAELDVGDEVRIKVMLCDVGKRKLSVKII